MSSLSCYSVKNWQGGWEILYYDRLDYSQIICSLSHALTIEMRVDMRVVSPNRSLNAIECCLRFFSYSLCHENSRSQIVASGFGNEKTHQA